MSTIDLPVRDLALATLDYVLEALAATGSRAYDNVIGLPTNTIHIDHCGTTLSVTTATAPSHRDRIEKLARDLHLDAALLRVSRVKDGLVYVTADVTLALLPCQPWSMTDLTLWAVAVVISGWCPIFSAHPSRSARTD
ncbi:hypothetical protein [uncultured Sphingomonas sp.]|uniref:hypothetical protein n=1 Tax=uncultured Sphingomonas sp. TaxID=158754 RepID=UPI0035CB8F5F